MGNDNRNPLMAAQGQQVVIVVLIPADGASQISRFHALHESGIAIKQIGNRHAKTLDRFPELRALQHTFQLGEHRNGADQLNPPQDGCIDELPGNSLPDQAGDGRVGIKNQPQAADPCGTR